ncbi:MAG TPA: N-methyl-L-tryptophan oxidase [Allosphingosinicella sp.]
METYDFVVIGLGVMGCAALSELSAHGKALGIEASAPGHDGGSSHGESRIFRLSNFESGAYEALALRSLDAWGKMDVRGEPVYLRTGIVEAGPRHSGLVAPREASTLDFVKSEQLTAGQINERFLAMTLPAHWLAYYHPEAGIVRANLAIRGFLRDACSRGAALVSRGVKSVRQQGDSVEVVTRDGERVGAAAAVVTTGPWIADLIPELAGKLGTTLQTVGWFEPLRPERASPDRMPVFIFDTEGPAGMIYGFPDFAGLGVKVASHERGPCRDIAKSRPAEHERRRALLPVRDALRSLLPAAAGRLKASTTCIYTNASDDEFIIDRRPGFPNIVFASACSGHGFKFAPAIGEMLSRLARDPRAMTRFPFGRPELAVKGVT